MGKNPKFIKSLLKIKVIFNFVSVYLIDDFSEGLKMRGRKWLLLEELLKSGKISEEEFKELSLPGKGVGYILSLLAERGSLSPKEAEDYFNRFGRGRGHRRKDGFGQYFGKGFGRRFGKWFCRWQGGFFEGR